MSDTVQYKCADCQKEFRGFRWWAFFRYCWHKAQPPITAM